MQTDQIKQLCLKMRNDCITMATAAGDSGFHFGGTLSLIEIIASLYFNVMTIDKNDFNSSCRDRLILSKGHGVPAVYAALKELGVLSENDLRTFKTDDTMLYGHPSLNNKIGIEFSTGSLGQGLSQGVGVSLALKHFQIDSKVFVVLGDGECDEGSVWEAAMSATKFKINNIIAIIDRNQLQYDGCTEEIMPLYSLEDKFRSFGWDVISIDGHNIESCIKAFSTSGDKPLAVIANTVKGKGISFMENNAAWHHARMNDKQKQTAIKELTEYGF